MSGTSLDGLDIAYCRFTCNDGAWNFKIITFESIDYNDEWRENLSDAINYNQEQLEALDITYGKWLGERTKDFMVRHNIKVDIIASHGHTIFHQPEKGITLQIGNGQEIANITGTNVVYNFRKLDVELGGQGAPLVPIGDEHLFGKYTACLNLGGIANVSFRKNDKRVAFDIGMANMPLNYLANQLDMPYDDSGQMAKSGKVNQDLMDRLNALEYYKLPYPKSLGYEWFLSEVKPLIDNSDISVEHKLATIVEHEVIQIAKSFTNNVVLAGEVLVAGGGVLNTYFIERLTYHTPDHLQIVIPVEEIINFKEALVFGLMGILRIRDEINCMSSVTGASSDSSGGIIVEPETK